MAKAELPPSPPPSDDAADPAPRTLAESAYRRIREDILCGRLPPGAPLRSDGLRRDYALGVSPLREALTRLSAEKLVIAVEQRGFRVAPIDAAEVRDITHLRILIEGDALRRSIAQGGLVWEARLTAAFHTLLGTSVPAGPGEAASASASASASAWGRAHHAFHRTLIDGCAAPWALSLSETLYLHSERYRILHARVSAVDRRDTRAEHRDIVDAALAGDADEAVASLARHYQRTERHVLAQLDRAHAAVEE